MFKIIIFTLYLLEIGRTVNLLSCIESFCFLLLQFNTTTSSPDFVLYPTPDFVYINYSTILNGERNPVTDSAKVAYPSTSTTLSLARGANYTIEASSFRMGFSESVKNPSDSFSGKQQIITFTELWSCLKHDYSALLIIIIHTSCCSHYT